MLVFSLNVFSDRLGVILILKVSTRCKWSFHEQWRWQLRCNVYCVSLIVDSVYINVVGLFMPYQWSVWLTLAVHYPVAEDGSFVLWWLESNLEKRSVVRDGARSFPFTNVCVWATNWLFRRIWCYFEARAHGGHEHRTASSSGSGM